VTPAGPAPPVKDDQSTQQGVLDVKIRLMFATIVASFGLLPALSMAQVQPPRPAAAAPQRSPEVVVLDVSKVFKDHARFNQSLEVMKKDVEAFENYIRQERTRINGLVETLKNYNPGTPEYKKVEEDAARITSDLQVQTQLKRKEFMDREAKLYYNTYIEVSRTVERFANEQGMSLVLRYNSEEIDENSRDSVLAGVNNAVVYQYKLDITGVITKLVNQGVSPNTVDQRNAPAIPRPGIQPGVQQR
jgi:Skp family chaperone for outer membrane proteins